MLNKLPTQPTSQKWGLMGTQKRSPAFCWGLTGVL